VQKGKSSNITVSSKYPTNDKVTSYKSSNTAVAKVDSKGKVTGVAAGTATITVTMKTGATATCKVTVKNPSVTLTKTSGSIKVGKTVTIAIKSKFPTNDTVKSYKSSNTSVATVNSKGVVKGVKAGTATITVTMASGAKATFKVTVKK
jgi:uncharacterized protein YjdB